MTRSRLLDEVRRVIRVNHYSIRAEETYLQWIKRYIFFHHKSILLIWVRLSFPPSYLTLL